MAWLVAAAPAARRGAGARALAARRGDDRQEIEGRQQQVLRAGGGALVGSLARRLEGLEGPVRLRRP